MEEPSYSISIFEGKMPYLFFITAINEAIDGGCLVVLPRTFLAGSPIFGSLEMTIESLLSAAAAFIMHTKTEPKKDGCTFLD